MFLPVYAHFQVQRRLWKKITKVIFLILTVSWLLYLCRPDITSVVDWAFKIKYLYLISFALLVLLLHAWQKACLPPGVKCSLHRQHALGRGKALHWLDSEPGDQRVQLSKLIPSLISPRCSFFPSLAYSGTPLTRRSGWDHRSPEGRPGFSDVPPPPTPPSCLGSQGFQFDPTFLCPFFSLLPSPVALSVLSFSAFGPFSWFLFP